VAICRRYAEALDQTQIDALANYVYAMSGGKADQAKVAKGKELFHSDTAACFYCHGDDAKGRQDIGSANLTDKVWLWIDVPGLADDAAKINAIKNCDCRWFGQGRYAGLGGPPECRTDQAADGLCA
jgi:cbb3-type cytochrome c oxidase subunit III